MKAQLFYALFIFLFIQVNLILSPQKREELLNKYTKKITLDNLGKIKPKIYDGPTLKYQYEDIIEKVINKYRFPMRYDYFGDTYCTIKIKDQGRCSSVWSFGVSSALEYRFYKVLGGDIRLSPQYPLSCYHKDCNKGSYLIDSYMNLIKNGIVTESCFPYTSGYDGIVEECPTKCINPDEEFKKYYAQNVYETESYLNQESFFDIVAIIIDQLITKGPVTSSFRVYRDFLNLDRNECSRNDFMYKYDEKSPFLGVHTVALYGYGFANGKFYWSIQNSWGINFCHLGLVNIEFGQVGIESVTFADPYIHKENTNDKTNINVNFIEQNLMCEIKVDTDSNYSKWNNTLEIRFINEEKNKSFVFHCNKNDIKGQNEKINCYNEKLNYNSYKGVYTFQDYGSLGDENEFILDEKFKSIKFDFLGYDYISAPYSEYYFVSDEGSRILMSFEPNRYDEKIILPTMYVGYDLNKPLSNQKSRR